jgi:HEAT repeat protein
MMQSDDHLETRVAAAYAVFQVMEEDVPAMDFLIEVAAQPDHNPAAAPLAVRFLGELGPRAKRALPVLVESCTYESEEALGFDAMLRGEALVAVSAVGGIDAIPVLRKALKSADALDRKVAAELISTWGREASSAVPELISAAQDGRDALSDSARGAAIEALGKLGADAQAAIPVLEEIAASANESEDPWLAGIAKESLDKIKGRDAPLREEGSQ